MATIEASIATSSKTKSSHLHCCVPNCTSDGRYDTALSFHRIPKDEVFRKQWIIKIRRDEGPHFKISNQTVVCSKHFTKYDYKGWCNIRKNLKSNAVPSVFDWTVTKPPRRAIKRTEASPAKSAKKQCREEAELGPSTSDITCDTSTVEYTAELDEQTTAAFKIDQLSVQLESARTECEKLQQQLYLERFGVARFSTDNSLINFYTGFNSYKLFLAFYECIEPSASNMQSAYYAASETVSLAGRKRCMLLIDEFFMFMCRLRVGLLEQDLSVRFNCSVPRVSRKIVTWANFLYFVLGNIPIWLPKPTVQELMPDCFKQLYPRTRVIVDCTKIRTQQPSSLVLNSQSYSNYKGTNTFKCLLGIAPHGAVTFISSLYTGCMSDVEITKLSGLLDLIEPGDDVMADKGFTLRKLLAEKGVTLNIPHFLSSKKQFTPSEVMDIEQIAKLRIHVERVNRLIKENHLFDTPLPLSLAGSANQLWTIACMLALFKGPIVQSWAE